MIKKLLTIFLIIVMCFSSSVFVSAYDEQDYLYENASISEAVLKELNGTKNSNKEDTYSASARVEVRNEPADVIIICIVVGMAMGFIINIVIASKNKSVRMQRNATVYTRNGSFVLTGQYDNFLYKNLQKTPIPKNDSNNKR